MVRPDVDLQHILIGVDRAFKGVRECKYMVLLARQA